MIKASFGSEYSLKSAPITGVYQYDTGQRLRIYDLPSDSTFRSEDELLSGDNVTVQVQYGYVGDSQTESRLAKLVSPILSKAYWEAEIPDYYLQKAQPVKVYVYVSYGESETGTRAKTRYEGSFTPIGRPAPGDQVTPDQKNAWDALVSEVNLAISNTNTATSSANAAAVVARDAASAAGSAADAANSAADAANSAAASASAAADATNAIGAKYDSMEIVNTVREYGSGNTASMTDDGTKKILTLGIERGEKGEKGDTGPAGVTFRLSGSTLYINTV